MCQEFSGCFSDVFRKNAGFVPVMFRTCSGRSIPGNVQDLSVIVLEISKTFPRNFPEISGTYPGDVQQMSQNKKTEISRKFHEIV